MVDGRHLGKIEKSTYINPGSSNFDKIWHDDTILTLLTALTDGRRHLEKLKIRHISAMV